MDFTFRLTHFVLYFLPPRALSQHIALLVQSLFVQRARDDKSMGQKVVEVSSPSAPAPAPAPPHRVRLVFDCMMQWNVHIVHEISGFQCCFLINPRFSKQSLPSISKMKRTQRSTYRSTVMDYGHGVESFFPQERRMNVCIFMAIRIRRGYWYNSIWIEIRENIFCWLKTRER